MDSTSVQPTIINQPAKGGRFTSRPIYGKFSILLLGIIIVSILPHYFEIYKSSDLVSVSLIVHAILYLGWFILFAVQSSLSASGKISIHKKLGYTSLVLFALLFISGVQMLAVVMGSYDSSWDDWYLHSRASFVWGILHTLISFSIFYVLGVLYRAQLQAHKRFMLMASLSMISASITRVAFLPFIPVDGMAVTLLGTYGLLVAPMIMDRIIFKSVHPVFKWGVPLYVITQIVCIGMLPATEIGRAIAFPF